EQMVDALVTDRDRSRTPLFQVFFSYGAGGRGGDEPDGGGADGHRPDPRSESVAAMFDLSVVVEEAGARGPRARFQYSTALFEPETIDRMVGHLVTLLEAVAADAGRPLSALPMLSPAEHRTLVYEWNDTALAVPASDPVHELIAWQSVADP